MILKRYQYYRDHCSNAAYFFEQDCVRNQYIAPNYPDFVFNLFTFIQFRTMNIKPKLNRKNFFICTSILTFVLF